MKGIYFMHRWPWVLHPNYCNPSLKQTRNKMLCLLAKRLGTILFKWTFVMLLVPKKMRRKCLHSWLSLNCPASKLGRERLPDSLILFIIRRKSPVRLNWKFAWILPGKWGREKGLSFSTFLLFYDSREIGKGR